MDGDESARTGGGHRVGATRVPGRQTEKREEQIGRQKEQQCVVPGAQIGTEGRESQENPEQQPGEEVEEKAVSVGDNRVHCSDRLAQRGSVRAGFAGPRQQDGSPA